VAQSAPILAVAAPGHHRLGVQLVHFTGQSVPSSRIVRSTLGEHQHHHCRLVIGVRDEDHTGLPGTQPGVQPEVADPRRITDQ